MGNGLRDVLLTPVNRSWKHRRVRRLVRSGPGIDQTPLPVALAESKHPSGLTAFGTPRNGNDLDMAEDLCLVINYRRERASEWPSGISPSDRP